jgi:hypothetical protein
VREEVHGQEADGHRCYRVVGDRLCQRPARVCLWHICAYMVTCTVQALLATTVYKRPHVAHEAHKSNPSTAHKGSPQNGREGVDSREEEEAGMRVVHACVEHRVECQAPGRVLQERCPRGHPALAPALSTSPSRQSAMEF